MYVVQKKLGACWNTPLNIRWKLCKKTSNVSSEQLHQLSRIWRDTHTFDGNLTLLVKAKLGGSSELTDRDHQLYEAHGIHDWFSHVEDSWWDAKANEMHALSDPGDSRGVFQSLKSIYGPRRSASSPMLSAG